MIDAQFIRDQNRDALTPLERDYADLGERLARSGLDIDSIAAQLTQFAVAIPSWGVGTGGTRFARFPIPGEPRDIFEKLEDCAIINQLTRSCPTVSTHFPWDKVEDLSALVEAATKAGLGFDAVNSNTFQDQPGQSLSYKYGSLSHTDERVRAQAVTHNLDCIEMGRKLGSKAITVWIADGSNFPGQSHLVGTLERYLDSAANIYAALPHDWTMLIEHKLYEPAFYSTVIADWGTSFACATTLGPQAKCLVDLGHHAPNVNIEQIVARLIQFDRMGGFHFNDSKYGDDDLDAGAIDPFRLFLVFNELVDATVRGVHSITPAYMMDQSHNLTDPIESLMTSAVELQRAYVQALLVDRASLSVFQHDNDALMAHRALKTAFTADVSPILAMVRHRKGGAIDPVACYRASQWRDKAVKSRPARLGAGAGIV